MVSQIEFREDEMKAELSSGNVRLFERTEADRLTAVGGVSLKVRDADGKFSHRRGAGD